MTQWRQLVSCDWLWHSHGSLIPGILDLGTNRSLKKPDRNIVELYVPIHRLLILPTPGTNQTRGFAEYHKSQELRTKNAVLLVLHQRFQSFTWNMNEHIYHTSQFNFLTEWQNDKLLKCIILRFEILTVSCALQYFLETNLRCQAVFVNLTWPFPWEIGAAGSLLSKETVTLHYKPTDSHNYLLHSSSHPQHVKDVIPFSQILRLWRLRL